MIAAIIQARLSSSRLPGKVLKPMNGRPMLSWMIERVKAAKKIEQIIIVTSVEASDDSIVEFCERENMPCSRGSLNDVLDRYYQAAKKFKVDTIVRLTGDCPLIDPKVIDILVDVYKNEKYDYVANTLQPHSTFPDGQDVEIFSFTNLERAWKEAKKPSDREHVTFYFWNNPDIFAIHNYQQDSNWSKYRLTVDYPEDFKIVENIVEYLYPKNNLFTMQEIISYLNENEGIKKLNAEINPNAGWQSAFENDKKAGF